MDMDTPCRAWIALWVIKVWITLRVLFGYAEKLLGFGIPLEKQE
jgi:hypothetical protein